jgi:4'-phosphopantetheinyl transferase
MITGYITEITEAAHLSDMADRLAELPTAMKERILAYSHREDHLARLCGKIMLAKLIADHGFQGRLTLSDILYGAYAKPYFDAPFYFNTAHSGALVICVASAVSAVGVDIEKIKKTNIDVFQDHFTDKEWLYIRSANDPVATFYELWVRKEAVTKAAGMGIFLPMQEIKIEDNTAIAGREMFYMHDIFIAADYKACLATNEKNDNMKIREISMEELLVTSVTLKI